MRLQDWIYDGASHMTETESRLSEAHHRIANNLALVAGFVRLQASALERDERTLGPREARRLLDEIGIRIDTVARLHRLLSVDPGQSRIDLGEYLTTTCEALAETAADQPVELFCDANACMTDADQAQLIGLVVAELVTNSLKYAHPAGAPGRIEVRCRKLGDSALLISVADDGVGLPEGFDPRTDGGLGMRVIRSLSQQLGADLDFDAGGLGLAVRITVPLKSS